MGDYDVIDTFFESLMLQAKNLGKDDFFLSLYEIGGAMQKKSRRASDPNSFVIDREVFEPLKSSVWFMVDNRK